MSMKPYMRVVALLLISALATGACSARAELRQAGRPDAASASPSADDTSGVPEEFRAACGKPGSKVVTQRLEVRIKHRDCDLTGVIIVNQGRGAVVPEPGVGVGSSSGVSIAVDEDTGDVTFTAEAEVAQY